MKISRNAGIAATALALLCLSITTALAKDELKKIDAAAKVIREVAATPKKGFPPAMLKNAYAVAIFPGASKTDFMVTGKQALGVLLVHDSENKWNAPVFVGLSGGTLGWQVIAGPLDIILIFKDKKSIDSMLKGKFTLNARHAVVIGPVGQSMKAVTKEEQTADITTYTRSGGTFMDATVAGSTLQINDTANSAFYETPKIRAEEILSGTAGKSSENIKSLQKLLTDYAARK